MPDEKGRNTLWEDIKWGPAGVGTRAAYDSFKEAGRAIYSPEARRQVVSDARETGRLLTSGAREIGRLATDSGRRRAVWGAVKSRFKRGRNGGRQ